jgi:protein SCO1
MNMSLKSWVSGNVSRRLLLAGLVMWVAKYAGATDITVQVVSADAKANTLSVRGRDLPEPGPDGAETLAVGAGDAMIGYVGHMVRGDLSKSSGTWRLDEIWPADADQTAATDAATQRLQRDIVDLGRKAYRDVGDTLPDFALYNENGELVRPSALRGQHLVINFIFTRCNNPNMCPANTQRMAQLQKDIKQAKLKNITLVTISFDPEHDTPGVLRQYAQAYNLDLSNFELLTGPPDEVNEVMQEFGILIKQQDDTLVHTLATMIVSPEGRITYRMPGDFWVVDEFLDRLKPSTPAVAKSDGN